MQQEQMKDAKKNARRQEKLGMANTGLNVFKTIMSFFP